MFLEGYLEYTNENEKGKVNQLDSVLVPCNILLSFDIAAYAHPVIIELVFLVPHIKLVYLACFIFKLISTKLIFLSLFICKLARF